MSATGISSTRNAKENISLLLRHCILASLNCRISLTNNGALLYHFNKIGITLPIGRSQFHSQNTMSQWGVGFGEFLHPPPAEKKQLNSVALFISLQTYLAIHGWNLQNWLNSESVATAVKQ